MNPYNILKKVLKLGTVLLLLMSLIGCGSKQELISADRVVEPIESIDQCKIGYWQVSDLWLKEMNETMSYYKAKLRECEEGGIFK